MIKYILKRFLNLIPVLLIISMLLFGISKIMPGDPVLLLMPQTGFKSAKEKEDTYNRLKSKYGYDRSIPEQYVAWMGRIASGDLGESTKYKRPVTEVISAPLRNTLILNLGVTVISFVLSIIIGIKSAVHPNS